MAEEQEEQFTKIVIDLPNAEDGVTGEGIWTVEVGPGLYEVRNSPWHTLEINFLDIVCAVAPSEDKNPVFTEVYRRSGHRSIHIVFLDQDEDKKRKVLDGLDTLGANYENANGSLYAIDLPPAASFEAVESFLSGQQDDGVLEQRYAPQPQPPGSGDRVQ
jgi:hypothetical protein